jgi:autotransporter-associated beta strand protein
LTFNIDANHGFFAYGAARLFANAMAFGNATNIGVGGTNGLILTGPLSLNTSNVALNVTNTATTTIGGVISGGLAGRTLTKKGSGTLLLTNANTYVDNTTVRAGTLLVANTSGSATGTGTVLAMSGGTVGGTGLIGGTCGADTGGAISPGIGVGTLTVGNGVSFNNGGTNIWELGANSTNNPGTDFDQLILTGGTLVLGGTSKLLIKFTGTATSPSNTNPFWQSTRQWKIVALTGTASNPTLFNFSSIAGTNGITAGKFSTSLEGSGSVILTYQPLVAPVPRPVIQSVAGAGTTNVLVTWTNAVAGSNYVLQYSSNLGTTNWTALAPVTATNTTASQTDTPPGGEMQRYYRVLMQ